MTPEPPHERPAGPTLPRLGAVSAAVLLGALVLFALQVYAQHHRAWDDAYITFRFAEHVAQGHGLCWNVGGERTEGYTSLLHVLLLATTTALGCKPEFASLWVGVLAVLLSVAVLARIVVRRTGRLHAVAALALGLFLADRNTAALATNGLETQLYCLMLCLVLAAALAWIEAPGRTRSLLLAVASCLAVLCRPDGVVFGSGVYAALLLFAWQTRRADPRRLRLVLESAAALAALGASYAAWKLSYFGYLLPNPYYVKSNQLTLNGSGHVLRYLESMATTFVPLLLLAAFHLRSGDLAAPFRDPERRARASVTLLPPLLALVYVLTITHEVGHFHRFSYPTYPFLVLAIAVALSRAARSFSWPRRALERSVEAVVCLAVLLVVQAHWEVVRDAGRLRPMNGYNRFFFRVARALESTGLGPRASILCNAAGIIPYVSRFSHLDRMGLACNDLSGREPMTHAERERYVWSQDVDVYLGYEPPAGPSAAGPDGDPLMRESYVTEILLAPDHSDPLDARVFAQGRDLLHQRMRVLRDRYEWLGELQWPSTRLRSFLYVRRDSPHHAELTRALRPLVAVEPADVDLALRD